MNHVWPQDDAQEGVPERGCNVEMGFWRWRGPAALLGKTPPRDPCMDLELRGGPQGLSGDCHHHGEDGGTFPVPGADPDGDPPPQFNSGASRGSPRMGGGPWLTSIPLAPVSGGVTPPQVPVNAGKRL